MSLYGRLVGGEDPGIAAHQFMAAISERERGELDRQDIIDMFEIETGDLVELDDILDKDDSLTADRSFEFGRMLHDSLLLSESKLHYTTSTDFYARIDAFV